MNVEDSEVTLNDKIRVQRSGEIIARGGDNGAKIGAGADGLAQGAGDDQCGDAVERGGELVGCQDAQTPVGRGTGVGERQGEA